MPDADPGKPVDNSTKERIDALSDTFKATSAEMRKEIDKRFDEEKQERVQDKNAVAEALKTAEERHEKAQNRGLKRIGIYVAVAGIIVGCIGGICTLLIRSYLDAVHRELGVMSASIVATNAEIKNLAEKHSKQSVEFARFGERLDTQSKMEGQIQKMSDQFRDSTNKLEDRIRELEKGNP